MPLLWSAIWFRSHQGGRRSSGSRIVRRFKADTFRIMEEEPERLSEIKGISEKMAMAIGEQVQEKRDMRQAMMFLQTTASP